MYYAKLARGRATFVAPRMIAFFHAIWGVRRAEEARRLSRPARALLRVLRREWEMATVDLRQDSGLTDRTAFNRAMDELQAAMLVVPSAVVYRPFTYIWTLAIGRFPDQLRRRVARPIAVREIARSFLAGAGHDAAGRAVASDRAFSPGSGSGQSRVGSRGLRNYARARRLSAGPNDRLLRELIGTEFVHAGRFHGVRWSDLPHARAQGRRGFSSTYRTQQPLSWIGPAQ